MLLAVGHSRRRRADGLEKGAEGTAVTGETSFLRLFSSGGPYFNGKPSE